LNGYGDNGQRSLKLWQLLHTYWLPNTYWNWQEYVVYVMLISVHNIKVTCEWHKAIKLNYKNSLTNTRSCLRVPSTCISSSNEVLSYRVGRGSYAVKLANVRARKQSYDHWKGWLAIQLWAYRTRKYKMSTLFSDHYLRNRSTLDIGVLGYIGIVSHKEHSPEVFHIPPGTLCIS